MEIGSSQAGSAWRYENTMALNSQPAITRMPLPSSILPLATHQRPTRKNTTDGITSIRLANDTTRLNICSTSLFLPPRGNLWVGERSIEAAVRGSGGTCGRLTQRIAALPLSRPGRAAAHPPAVRRKRDLPLALFSE